MPPVYPCKFHPPLELPKCPLVATAIMTQAIEEQVQRRPEQWVWFHRRWQRPPPDDPTQKRRRQR